MQTPPPAESGTPQLPISEAARHAPLWSFVAGACLLVALVPVIQWLDSLSNMSAATSMAPAPAALLLLASILLVHGLVRLLGRLMGRKRSAGNPAFKHGLLVIYAMLIIGLPLCSVGLVRPFYGSLTAVLDEIVNRDVATVAVAYEAQDPRVYPKVDLPERLAFDATNEQIEAHRREREQAILEIKGFFQGRWPGLKVPQPEGGYAYEDIAPDALAAISPLQAAQTKLSYVPWHLWIWPLVHWFVLLVLVYLLLLSVSELLRQRWLVHENLAAPLATLPMALMDGSVGDDSGKPQPIFRSVMFWIAFSLAVGYGVVQGLGHYKQINLTGYISLSATLTEKPWNVISNTIIVFSPVLLGIGFLLSLEVSRSIWLFFFVGALLTVIGNQAGWAVTRGAEADSFSRPGFPFLHDQAAGAMLAWGLLLLWQTRRAIVGQSRGEQPAPRWIGLAVGVLFVAVVLWSLRLGLADWRLAALMTACLVLFAISWARIRLVAGLPFASMTPTAARYNLMLGGPTLWKPGGSMSAADHGFLTQSLLPGTAASHLELASVASHYRMRRASLYWACGLGFVLSMAVGMVSLLVFHYATGGQGGGGSLDYAATKHPMYVFFQYAGRFVDKGNLDTVRLSATIIGAVFMLVLLLLRAKVLGFPLHPIGFVLLGISGMSAQGFYAPFTGNSVYILWAPMLIAWLAKMYVIRIGGMDLYQRCRPIAYGLILGHLLILGLWVIGHAVYFHSIDAKLGSAFVL